MVEGITWLASKWHGWPGASVHPSLPFFSLKTWKNLLCSHLLLQPEAMTFVPGLSPLESLLQGYPIPGSCLDFTTHQASWSPWQPLAVLSTEFIISIVSRVRYFEPLKAVMCGLATQRHSHGRHGPRCHKLSPPYG